MTRSAIRAVVLDIDDTLVLTEAACFALENEVLGAIGRPPMERTIHHATWGQPLLDAMLIRSPGISLDDFVSTYQPLMSRYIRDGRLDVVSEANLAALDDLRRAGLQIMILTSRTRTEVEHFLLPDHALAARITAIYHADNTAHPKPDPRAFDELLAHSGLAPGQCVYVGDSPTDAQAANGAGVRFIANLASGLRRPEDFTDHHVDAFVPTFSEIVCATASLSLPARGDD